MQRKNYYRIVLAVGILVLMAAACAPVADSGDAEEPQAEEPTDPPAPTDAPAAEPTDEPAAEPTEESSAEPTDEPTAEPTDEPTDTSFVGTMARTATCFSEPKETASEIGVVEEGNSVTILGRGVGANWVAIASPVNPDVGCWVQEADLSFDGEVADLPIYGRSGRSSEEPVVLPDGFDSEVLTDVICLFGPGSGYSPVAALLAGETVRVWGKGVGSGWLVVALIENGDNCWLPEDTVNFTGGTDSLTILNAPPKQ